MERREYESEMTITKRVVLERLLSAEKPVKSYELSKLTNKKGSVIRKAVHELRVGGAPICSSKRGYWIAGNEYEIELSIEDLTKRRNSIDEAIRAMSVADVDNWRENNEDYKSAVRSSL